MEWMSSIDASFLHVENDVTPMHIGGVSLFEGPPPPFEDLRRMVESKTSVPHFYVTHEYKVGALLDHAAVEHRVHVAALVGVLVEALRADVLVRPDLTETLRVLLRAAAAQVADRDALKVNVDRVVGGVLLGLAALPFLAVGLVALAAAGKAA